MADARRLEGKVAFITGAARGQGRSHALTLAREGCAIAALDICEDVPEIYPLGTADELHKTVADCEAHGVNAIALKADVRDRAAVGAAVGEAIDRLGKVDILLNNAGICKGDAVHLMSGEVLDEIIDVNVKGIFHTTMNVVPGMIERNEGCIVSTASAGGLKAVPYVSHYVASKGAVVAATKSWANELAPYGINVNCVCPGTILSGMTTGLAAQMDTDPVSGQVVGFGNVDIASAFVAFNRNNLFQDDRGVVTAQDISNMILYLCLPEGRMITGQALAVDAGWSAS